MERARRGRRSVRRSGKSRRAARSYGSRSSSPRGSSRRGRVRASRAPRGSPCRSSRARAGRVSSATTRASAGRRSATRRRRSPLPRVEKNPPAAFRALELGRARQHVEELSADVARARASRGTGTRGCRRAPLRPFRRASDERIGKHASRPMATMNPYPWTVMGPILNEDGQHDLWVGKRPGNRHESRPHAYHVCPLVLRRSPL